MLTVKMPVFSTSDLLAAAPVTVLCVGAIIAMLQSVFEKISSRIWVATTVFGSIITSFVMTIWVEKAVPAASYYSGGILVESVALFGQQLILAIIFTMSLLILVTHDSKRFFKAEIASIFLMVLAGMLVMVSCDDLITLFVGLELSSIGLYALIGYINPSQRSREGAVKYFVLGSFAAAVLLFGIALLYSGTGSLLISEMVRDFPRYKDHAWIELGSVLVIVGFGFKMALAPFCLWVPDAYEAAPTGLTAIMATCVKVMVIIAFLRIFSQGLASLSEVALPSMMFLSMLSMLFGNILALIQSNLKRMLAYSSIAHSGYMAMALCALASSSGTLPIDSVLFYLMGYSAVSIATFGILMWLENERAENLHLDDLAGLFRKSPWASVALTICMFSLAGLPPTIGFINKFFVFNAALFSQMYSLVIVAVIGSAISLYYYLRIIVRIFMSEPISIGATLNFQRSWTVVAITTILLFVSLLVGTVLPGNVMASLRSTSSELIAQ